MKNKRLVAILAVVLVLCAAVSLSVFAAMSVRETKNIVPEPVSPAENTQSTEPEVAELPDDQNTEPGITVILDDPFAEVETNTSSTQNKEFVKSDIPRTKTYTAGGVSISLTYQKTEVRTSGKEEDTYLGTDGYEYSFGADGGLVGKGMSRALLSQTWGDVNEKRAAGICISEQEALTIAENVGRELFGDRFDLMVYDSIRQDEGTGDYTVYYYQRLGKDGFVRGITYYVTIYSDGTLFSCGMPDYDAMSEFDPSLLGGITKEAICRDLDVQTRERYRDQSTEHEVDDSITLICENGEYYLRVYVDVTVFEGPIEIEGKTFHPKYITVDMYRYPLTQQQD